jgi:TRAP-type C4-dicarboxylate transport system permease small subunit
MKEETIASPKLHPSAGAVFDRILEVFTWIAFGIIVVMTVLICADVILRYVLHSSQPFIDELVEYSIVYITFLGASWVLKTDAHVKLDTLFQYISPRSVAMLNTITSAVCAIVCVVVGWYGTLLVKDLFLDGARLLTVLEPLKALVFLPIPIGNFLLFIQFIRRTLGYYREWQQQAK